MRAKDSSRNLGAMLMPALSVTVIGLCVGLVLALPNLSSAIIVRSLIGAWGGFVLGALLGVAIDAVVQAGYWVAIVGHVAALAGAIAASRGRPATI